MAAKKTNQTSTDTNPDPISGEPGSHPVGTGVGAALAGAAAGAAGGALGGPVGTVIGAAAGAVAGGYAGKAVEESFDPTAEDAYWREEYRNRSYVDQGTDYDTYRPAYQYGWETRNQYAGRRFEDVETDLERDWATRRGQSSLNWDRAKLAVHDAWNRVTTDDVDRRVPR
jgi:hypothetical protein